MQTVKLLLKFKVDVNVADNVSSNEVVILPVYKFINSSYFLSSGRMAGHLYMLQCKQDVET